jgi:hypothetical protein
MSRTYFVRLEPRSTTGDLAPGLAARVADPLWLLGRQWQLGELLADDAGTPTSVDLAAETASLAVTTVPGGGRQPYDPAARPLDLLAADQVRTQPAGRRWTARQRVDTGRAFVRALSDAGLGSYAAGYRGAYQLAGATAEVRTADPNGARLLDVAAGRLPDGELLYEALAPALRTGAALPATPVIAAGDAAGVRAAAEAWQAFCDATVTEPAGGTWAPQRLAHAFSAATGTGPGATVLDVDGWRGEDLDWHSFDVRPNSAPTGFTALPPSQTLPTGVRFHGMPNTRWWEFEDAQVDLGAVDAGPSDVARLALLEFALLYANDFFAVPLRLPVGSLTRIASLVVGDSFGMRLQVGPATYGTQRQGAQRWSMFTLTEHDPKAPQGAAVAGLFFLPPVATQVLTGAPVEEVHLLRDEMANLAWGVERRYQGEAGGGTEPVEELARSGVAADPPGEGATLHYRLGTTVPPYWFPMVGVTDGGGPALRLEQMANRPATVVPRGRLLELGGPPLPDAEVPREGVRLLRQDALARWSDGTTFGWSRRVRRVGRGEGSSGLRFDVAELTDGVGG